MDPRIIKQFNDCEENLEKLGELNVEAKEDIHYCVGGTLKKEYLDSCVLVDNRIKKVQNELLQLQKLLLGLDG